jgi:uncharacterized protein
MSRFRYQHEDLFLLPQNEEQYILYAPLRRAIAAISPSLALALQKFLQEGEDGLNSTEKELLDQLEQTGIFAGPAPEPPLQPKVEEFLPFQATLFLTSRCNLRCTYCYADAGKKDVEMPWPVAKNAVDFVAANALKLGSGKMVVGFHGGGEPTVAWDLLVKITDYAHKIASENDLELEIYAASNGLLSPVQREYIAQNFSNLNISLDGPEDIQNTNRPTVGGKGSWLGIKETLDYFDQRSFPYGFRATITRVSVSRLNEIVSCFTREFKPEYIQIEPAWSCGRCLTSGETPPDDKVFIKNFIAASKQARDSGVNIHYSAARLDTLTSKFCAAPGDNFTVLPEGIVTSCYEITEGDDPRAELFHFGRFSPEKGQFEFDDAKLARLRTLTVDQFDHCSDCFCKWHCAGDCLSKVFQTSDEKQHSGSSRCEMNRALTRQQLLETMTTNPDRGEI